jgi:hypothetical protein
MQDSFHVTVRKPPPTSPKFDMSTLDVNQNADNEFGGGAALAAVGAEWDYTYLVPLMLDP